MDKEQAQMFWRVFSTPDGQQVLKKLNAKYREKTDFAPSSLEISYERGQRDVIGFINREIERGGKVDGASTDE